MDRAFLHPGLRRIGIYPLDGLAAIQSVLARTGIDPKRLELELVEASITEHPAQTIANLEQLSRLGIGLAVDDFGTGCSSLGCIKRLPIWRLKIHRSFIARLMTSADDAAIVHAVIGLAHSLGLAVLAEGVETSAQAELLIREGCDEAQGYTERTWVFRKAGCVPRASGQGAPTRRSGPYGEEA